MKIYKKLTNDYTTTSNEIFRHGLSFKAIGLYLYIVSKPDGWEFTIAGASQQVKDGKESIQAGLKELEAAGFLVRKQARVGGKYAKNEWYVADKPLTENPPTGNPLTENPSQVITNQVKTKEEPAYAGETPDVILVKPGGEFEKKVADLTGVVLPGSHPKAFGNGDVNELMVHFKATMGLPILDDSDKQNRQYAWLAIKKFGGVDKVKALITAASMNQFWRHKIASFRKLYYNGVTIISETRGSGKVYDATREGL